MIENRKEHLEFEYKNITIDQIGQHKTIFLRQGKDYINDAEWDNIKTVDGNDGSKTIKNKAKDKSGEWCDEWSNKHLEKWAKKNGKRDNQEWHEEWYKKHKYLPKKKDEDGNELDEYESDGSQVDESNCQKWGRNDDTREEWHEKWGEVYRDDRREKWCDKWQVDLDSGLKKGENWGQIYTEDY